MKIEKSLLLILLLIGFSGCAPRFASRHADPHLQRKINQQSQEIVRKLQLENRDRDLRRFYSTVQRYLGTPYLYSGDSRRGMDCSGLVKRVYQEIFGVKLPHNAYQQYQLSQSVSIYEVEPGDLIFFDTTGRGGIDHVGIFLGSNYMVHASSIYGVVVARLDENYFSSRLVGAGRMIAK
ncbi:MAG: C40 family peptidase [bacterium]|nr:C40 family peptidase [bacterium]